jgi:hypothetical protein
VSSAAELRKADATLRERALLASQGPWESDQRRMTVWADHGDCQVVRSDVDGPDADLDYIATMHPGVGLALADWLEVEAGYQWTTSTERSNAALTVARLINGGAS